MSVRFLRAEAGASGYPPALSRLLGEAAPASLTLLGETRLLHAGLTALFCSVRVSPELVLPTYDLARGLRDAGVAVAGGFQSPMERECLDLMLRGRLPVVLAPARDIGRIRLAPPLRDALDRRRLLVVSAFPGVRRPTEALATRRNRLVAALAERVVVAYASPGGRLFRLAQEALAWGKPVFCLAHPSNHDLMLMGAAALEPAGRARVPAGD